jgi:SecD/SecF fusion protein
MKPFYNRILICVIPCVIAAAIVGTALYRYIYAGGGFKLGVDLVGGTILVYEIDPDKKLPGDYKPEQLVATLKRRIDPNDLKNVIIRPVSNTRVEIVLPTGGAHQAEIDDKRWGNLVDVVQKEFKVSNRVKDVGRDQPANLAFAVKQDLDQAAWNQLIVDATAKWPEVKKGLEDAKPPIKVDDTVRFRDVLKAAGAKEDEAVAFVNENYTKKLTPLNKIEEFVAAHSKTDNQRKDVSAEGVEEIKKLISQTGSLEFRIVANAHDDKEAIEAAKAWIEVPGDTPAALAERADHQRILRERAERGLPPPSPNTDGKLFAWSNGEKGSAESHGEANYSWVELGKQERQTLGLNNDASTTDFRWKQAADARQANKTFTTPADSGDFLVYSRESVNNRLTPEERKAKQVEYFVLVRDPAPNQRITGENLPPSNVTVGRDKTMNPSIDFSFDSRGSNLFGDVTEANRPTGNPPFYRHLAILLDEQIISAPRLLQAIHGNGQITGNYKYDEASDIVKLLRSGALPATLKPVPVSENTIGPTLGADTISSGTWSVGIAFIAILAFMLAYYHFAGIVACVALLANLLLTVAFMVMVGATFTLPGLAGLVLMLGMAVDANVLIYERIREERDRGLNMVQAIRNGYDRAFPTIIDTHLSSIFTAVVLWAIGTDQLKGFGISLTFGLIISLFTSLYMTRLMFDLALARNVKWATNLTMFRLLTKTNIDFMAIRYYWFTATIIITILGMALFLSRGKQGLNIDFNGGTAYTGQLEKPKDITYLRDLLGDAHQKTRLAVKEVQQGDTETRYIITYADGTKQTVELADPPGGPGATKEQRELALKERASILPDWSVEQIFLGGENALSGGSKFFTVRTSEKAPELVQLTIDRLLTDKDNNSLLTKITLDKYPVSNGGKTAELYFSDFASPSNVRALLEREAHTLGVPDTVGFELAGNAGEGKDQRYKRMKLEVTGGEAAKVDEAKLTSILKATADAYAARPQPERLENFDSQLATETQRRALYAILASWGAILLYLWFRFGTWTFGLAAVFCLIHDLFFTLGGIALCHYIHNSMPGLATFLGLHDFKIDLPSVAALLTLVGYSVNDTIVVFDRIREVRGKSPELTPKMINDSVNQTLSRTLLTAFSVWLVVIVLYIWGGEGIHLFAFVMVIGVIVGTYSSIYIASPLLLIFGEGQPKTRVAPREQRTEVQSASV